MSWKGATVGACAAAAFAVSQAHALPPIPAPETELTLAEPIARCRPIDFTHIDVQWNPVRGVHELTISGQKPYANMRVSLSHRSYYGRPAWWRTTVVGCLKSFGIPIPTPYYITMSLDNFVGTRGVEIIGESTTARKAISQR